MSDGLLLFGLRSVGLSLGEYALHDECIGLALRFHEGSAVNPYIDPESEILRNEFVLTNQERLHRAEANALSACSTLLQL